MDGLEPKIDFFPKASAKVKGPGYPPSMRRENGIRIYPPSPDPVGEEDPIEEAGSLEERKEEIKLDNKAALSSSQESAMILSKLNVIADSKFASIFKKLRAVEGRLNRIEALLKGGVKTNDTYWGFDNWRDLRPYGSAIGMVDKVYAMIFDAVDNNNGILRDNGGNRSRKRPNLSFHGEDDA